MVRLRKTAGVYRSSKLSLCWNAVHLTTCQRWRAVCWSHRPSSKGSKANAMTAFSMAQGMSKGVDSSCMHACMLLHGHLHQLHAGSPGVTHTAVHNPEIHTWIPSWYSCVLNLYRYSSTNYEPNVHYDCWRWSRTVKCRPHWSTKL